MSTKPNDTGCKVCGRATDDMRRGLCQMHYRRFMAKLQSISDKEAARLFEEKCIVDGWIEQKQRGGRPKDEDPFDEVLREVQAEFTRDINKAVTRELSAEAQKAEIEAEKQAKQATKRKAN